MGWFEDATAWVEQAVTDTVDFVEDAVQDPLGALQDIGQAVGQAAADIGEAFTDAAVAVGDFTMNALDTFVFDPVDFITGGAIDVDYDDGQFTAGLDFGIASVGLSVGKQGFSADAGFDIGIASGEISLDPSDGFAASGSIGLDWGPLPYAEGHVEISPEGDISIGGQLQGTLPLPGLVIDLEASGDLYRHPDGSWGASGGAALDVDGPFGTGISLEGDVSVSKDSDGFNASASGEFDVDGPLGTGVSAGGDASVFAGPGGVGASAAGELDLDGPLGSGASTSGDVSLGINTDGSFTSAAGGDIDLDVPFGVGVGASGDASISVDNGDVDAALSTQFAVDDSVGVDSGPLDDFSAAIASTESVEAEAEKVWDDLQP